MFQAQVQEQGKFLEILWFLLCLISSPIVRGKQRELYSTTRSKTLRVCWGSLKVVSTVPPLSAVMSSLPGALRKFYYFLTNHPCRAKLNWMCVGQSTVIYGLFGPQDFMPFPKMFLRSRPLTTASRTTFTCSPCHTEMHVPVASTEGFFLVVSQASCRIIIFPLNLVIPAWLEEIP